jgi:hypothetical protein
MNNILEGRRGEGRHYYLRNLDVAVEGSSLRSECPATVALRFIARQPKTRLRLKQFGCLTLHFTKSHNVSGIFVHGMLPFNCMFLTKSLGIDVP